MARDSLISNSADVAFVTESGAGMGIPIATTEMFPRGRVVARMHPNSAFESGRADKQRAFGLRPRRRAAQRER